MMTLDVVNLKNEKVGSVELPETIFGVAVNEALVLQVVKAQLAGLRQGTAKNKTKGFVRGGGRKPFKQKGTGNARQGSSRSPLNPGGGSNFGPQPRDYTQYTNKKMVAGAIRSVLSDKLASGRLVVVDAWSLKKASTGDLAKTLKKAFSTNDAFIVDGENLPLALSSRNLPKVAVAQPEGINVYDMVRHEWLMITKQALDGVVARAGKGA